MRMTPARLVAFRLFLIAFGWIPGLSFAVKKILVRIFVRRKSGPRYVAQSRFLDLARLEEQARQNASQAARRREGPGAKTAARPREAVPKARREGPGGASRPYWIGGLALLAAFLLCHARYVKSGFFMYDEILYLQQNTMAAAHLSNAVKGAVSPALMADLQRNAASPFGGALPRAAGTDRASAARAYFRTLAAAHTKPLFHAPLPPLAAFLGLPMREGLQVSANLLCGFVSAAVFGALFARRFGPPAGIVAAALLAFSLTHSCYLPSGFPVTMQACLLVAGSAFFLWSFDAREKTASAAWAAAAGAALALSQLAYPTTIFSLIVLALLEGVAALIVLRRNAQALAILGGLAVLAVLPHMPSLLWYKAGLQQDHVLVSRLGEGTRRAIVLVLSAVSVALSAALLARLRRHSVYAVRLGWLCFAASVVFILVNLLYSSFGPGYFTMLVVHANPAVGQKRHFAEAPEMLAHAEGLPLFAVGAACLAGGWILFLSRVLRARAGRWDVLATLWCALTYALILRYGYHFERRNYLALFMLSFLAALYGPAEWLKIGPDRKKNAAKWGAAALCAALLAANWAARHGALYWNRYRAAGEASRACSESLLSPIFATPISYFNPAPLPQQRIVSLYENLAPGRQVGILACEQRCSSQTASVAVPTGVVLREHMTPVFQTDAHMCPWQDGVSQTRSLWRDTLWTSSYDYVIRLYRTTPETTARLVNAATAFDPEGWRPMPPGPPSFSASYFALYNQTALVTSGDGLRLVSKDLCGLFGKPRGRLFLDVFSFGSAENVLQTEIGGRHCEVRFSSPGERRLWVPLGFWTKEEGAALAIRTVRTGQRAAYILGLGLYPLASEADSPCE